METENIPAVESAPTEAIAEVEIPVTDEVKAESVTEEKDQEIVPEQTSDFDLAELTANIDKILEEAKIVVTEPSFFPDKSDDDDVTKVIDDLMELNDQIQSQLSSKDEEVQEQV